MVKTEKPVNVLLVDDKPANLLALEAVLESLGLNLVKAQSGKEALEKIQNEDIAVILLDVRMPDMDGFETANYLRQRERDHNTPIIFLTAAQENKKEIDRAYAIGAIDYMLKPFDPSVLRTKVSVLSGLYCENMEMKRIIEKLNRKIAELETQNLILTAKMQ